MRGFAPIALALLVLLPSTSAQDARGGLDILIERGVALMAAERQQEALAYFTMLRSAAPKDPRIPFYMAQCEFNLYLLDSELDRLESARKLIEAAIDLDSELKGTGYLWGLVNFHQGRHGDAVEGFRLALRRGIRDARIFLAQALFRHGQGLADREEYDSPEEVIPIFEEATLRLESLKDDLRLLPQGRREFRILWLKSQVNLSALHQKAGNYPIARRLLEEVIRQEPKNHLLHYEMGKLLGEMQKLDEAAVYYEKSLELADDPDFLDPQLQLGYICSQQGRPEKAEEHFQTFLDRYPDSWDAHLYLAGHRALTGDLDAAIAEYLRCVELDRSGFAAIYKLSLLLRRARRPAEAMKWQLLYEHLKAKKKGT